MPRERRATSGGPVRRQLEAEQTRGAAHHLLQLRHRVEIEPHRNAEAVAQRRRDQPLPRGRADQGEFGQVDAHRAGGRPLADHQIEHPVLHRRIEDLLHRRREPVDLVDEQDVAILEIGEQGGEVARFGDHRPGGGAEADAELARDDLRQRGLAEPRRPEEQHMVERIAARLRRLDEDPQIFPRRLLPDKLVERLGAQRGVEVLGPALGRGDAVRVAHFAAFLSAVRTSRSKPRFRTDLRFGLCHCGRSVGRAEAEIDERGNRVLALAALRHRRTACAERDAAGLVLQLVGDALGQLGADALRPGDHRMVAARHRAVDLVDGQGGEDGEGDAGADALHRGEQPEPVALRRAGEADQADEILGDQHFGVEHDLLADRAQRGERAGGGGDQIADAVDVEHGMVGAERRRAGP